MWLFTANNGDVLMAGGGGGILCRNPTRQCPYAPHHLPQTLSPTSLRRTRNSLLLVSAKKLSRIGRFDSKNRRTSTTTTTQDQDEDAPELNYGEEIGGEEVGSVEVDDGYFLPKLPGDEPDFWEGEQWDGLGFFVEYMWAFGIVFALIACGVAVVTYNEGATDFKETPAYKESVQSRDLLEEPEASNSDVFESNPTEVAPSLE